MQPEETIPMNSPRDAQLAPVPSLFARTRGTRWLPLAGSARRRGGACGLRRRQRPAAATDQQHPPASGQQQPAPLATSMNVMSSPPQYVSGGDARIEVQAPRPRMPSSSCGSTAPHRPRLRAGENRLEGVVAGMTTATTCSKLRLDKTRGMLTSLKLTNHPITGPMFSGPQQHAVRLHDDPGRRRQAAAGRQRVAARLRGVRRAAAARSATAATARSRPS